MLEKLILAVILTFSIYIRYNPVIAHQHWTQFHPENPQLKTAFVTQKGQ